MNDNLKSYIKISEEINNNLVDNVFELNIRNANLIENPYRSKPNAPNDFNEMSLNISNLDITKLIQLFKMNKKALKDFFKLLIFEFRPANEITCVVNEFSDIIDNDVFESLFNFCIENNHFNLLDAVLEKSKEFILESHIPSLFEFLSNLDFSKSESSTEVNSNSNKNGSLSSNTPKKNASARKENGSEIKAKKAESNMSSRAVIMLKNVFEINFDSAYLIKEYKSKEFSYSQLKQIVCLLNNLINNITKEIQSTDKSELIKIYENMLSHFTIFALLNEVYLHKANQSEEDYNALKREIKALSDIIKKQKTVLEKSLAEESNKRELANIKRKINAFRTYGTQEDVIYETINL